MTPHQTAVHTLCQLREHMTEHEAIAFAWSKLGHYAKLATSWREAGVDPELVAEFEATVRALHGRAHELPALIIAACLEAGLTQHQDPIEERDPTPEKQPPSPRWPSSIATIDRLAEGGFYGVTCVSGAPKAGKSLLAMASAIEAARAGWNVLYFDAELTRGNLSNRILRYVGGVPDWLRERMRIFSVSPGATPEHLCDKAKRSLSLDCERLLIVLDSINSLAAMAEVGGEGYWRNMDALLVWAAEARRRSEGLVSALVVAELNVAGQAKGGLKLPYRCDLVLGMRKGDAPELVRMSIDYAREAGNGADLGVFVREWQRGVFEK